MFNAKFWQEIRREYSKGYELFLHYITKNGSVNYFENFNQMEDYFLKSKNICYCNIVDFFDRQGIIIEIHCLGKDIKNYDSPFSFSLGMQIDKMNWYKTRDEAKLEAVKKSFEILEEMENKK